MATPAKVKVIATEFENLEDNDIQEFLDIASNFVNDSLYGDLAGDAKAYLAAHLIKISNSNGQNAIVSVNQGGNVGATKSYQGSDDDLAQTSYGRVFRMLRKGAIKPTMCVT